MTTLVEQVRNITSTEDDDYFSDEFVLSCLNRAKDHIVETGIKLERQSKKSLRFLDELRDTQAITFDTFSSYSSFYKTTASIPSDAQAYVFLELDQVNLQEIFNLKPVNYGNAIPTPQEGYFLVYDDKYEFYLDVDTYTSFVLRYIKNYSSIESADTTIADLNDEAQKAILYYAGYLQTIADATFQSEEFLGPYKQFIGDLA